MRDSGSDCRRVDHLGRHRVRLDHSTGRRGNRVRLLDAFRWLRGWPLVVLLTSCSDEYTTIRLASAVRADTTGGTQPYVTMMRNTAISVTLVDSIDTDVHRTGAEFRATLTQCIVVDRDTVFDVGAGARGILNSVIESGGHRLSAELQFSLTELQDSKGQWTRIGTHTIQERRASSTSTEIILVGGGGMVTGPDSLPPSRKQGIFHGPGTELVFFSNESTRIALR